MNAISLPFRNEFPFASMFRDLDRFMRDQEAATMGSAGSQPSFRTEQDQDAYHVTAELPGFTDKDVHVDIHRGVLTVSGERTLRSPEGFSLTHRERGGVKFSRSIRLPDEIDEENVNARMADGVLSLTLPKRADVKPRQIAVKSA